MELKNSKDILKALFNSSVIESVKNQFTNGKEKVSIESNDMSFRLHMVNGININFEFLLRIDDGTKTHSYEKVIESGLEYTIGPTEVWFYKPVGFFTLNNHSNSLDIEFTIIKEFENDLEFLLHNNDLSINIPIKKLSLEENGVLAAFSMETMVRAEKKIDDSLIANGLQCDIYISEDGFPQVFLDDKYGFLSQNPIAIYFYNGPNTANAMMNNLHVWKKLKSMNLMTLYKNAR